MIDRFYLKDALSFKEAILEFKNGLVVVTGASGSGKSVLMNTLLSSFGLSDGDASLCEANVDWYINDDSGIINDDVNVFRQVKKEKTRYFINNQSLSKKNIAQISSKYIKHLSLKDYSDFEPINLLKLLDNNISSPLHVKSLAKLSKLFENYKKLKDELKQIEDEEKRIVELKEFCEYEISKIQSVAPVVGEDIELLHVKKLLSKKEKVEELISQSQEIFNFESSVNSALSSLEQDSSFFDDTMNELREHFDKAMDKFEELESVDIEYVLNRLEAISELKNRYGDIEEILAHKDSKIQELKRYENISIEKSQLQEDINAIQKELDTISKTVHDNRVKELPSLQKSINSYLKQLYMKDISLELIECSLSSLGKDLLEIKLNESTLNKISSGEFNRLRLAILALKAENIRDSGGVLMLDEIDANLSGEESMSVAKVLRKLSKKYQIFVISHQPQLTSMGEQHFCVSKDKHSHVKELTNEQRVQEIARMISGDEITSNATSFAMELLECAL